MIKLKSGIAVIISTLLLICSAPVMVCGANEVITTDVNVLTGKVDVSFNIPDGKLNQRISVQIINPGKDISNPASISEALQYNTQGKLSSDGKFDFSFVLSDNAQTGDYTVYAKVYGKAEALTDTFYFANEETADSIIKSLDEATSSGEVESIFEGKETTLGVNLTYLKDAYREELYEDIVTAESFYQDGAMSENRKAFLKVCSESIVEQAIADRENVNDVLSSYQEHLGCPVLFEYYNGLKNKTAAENFLAEKIRAGVQESFSEKFALALLTQYEKSVSPLTWQMYETLLFDVAEETGMTGLDKATYESLTDKKSAMEKFIDTVGISGQEPANLTEVVEIFNDIVDECSEQNPPPEIVTPSQGGIGGGGGGGGSLSINVQPSDADETENTDEKDDYVFSDIENVKWAHEAITALTEKGCISGVGDGKFSPNTYVKREEFLKILLSALELVKADAECSFDDIDQNGWYYTYVASAYEQNIISGIGDGMFGIGNYITRQDAAVMICRAAKYHLKSGNNVFTDDIDISDYAKDAVYTLNQMKIINGADNNNFLPLANATRAEAAKMIYEALKYQE